MAIRTVIGLIPAAGVTNAMLAGSIAATKLSLSDTFNFTGTLQANGVSILAGDLHYAVVAAASTANIADRAAGAPDPLDGVSLSANNDVLVKDQTTTNQNGIFNVDTVGTGVNGAWTRAVERDAASELPVGMLVYVKAGTVSAEKMFRLKTFAGTLDTDPIVFEEVEEGLTMTNSGEPEIPSGTINGSNLNFDLSAANTVFVAVSVDGVQQAPSVYSVAAGAGAGGVDQLQFGSGNAPATGAALECIVFRRL